jgi:predicted amidohydrolase YtcJ
MNFADMILYNGKVITMENESSVFTAVAIKDKKILFVGSDEEIELYKNEITEVINLEGKTLLPGFIDSHVHFTQTGLSTLAVDLTTATSVKEILSAIKKEYEDNPDIQFIRGSGYDDEKVSEKRPPSIKELDEIVPDKAVFLVRIDSHSMTVNSIGLKKLNLPEDTNGIDKDEKGNPTGILRATANSMARSRVLDLIDDDTRIVALNKAAVLAMKRGVTTVNALEGGKLFNDKDVEVILKNKDIVPIELVLFYQTTDVEKVISLGLNRIGGCIILDGSFGSRTAALLQPYSDDNTKDGELYYSQEEINQFVEDAHKAGLQVTVHALGDRAVQQILTAYDLAMKKYPREDARHRIEHIELPSMDQIKVAKKLGVIFSVQPAFEYYWGGLDGMYGTRLGKERASRTNPYKTIIESGCLLIGGSDSDVTPIDPLLGVHGAVNHSNVNERIDVFSALKMFTINGAKAVFMEGHKGTIEAGKDADLVVLYENPIDTPINRIKDIKVDTTIKSGKIIFKS